MPDYTRQANLFKLLMHPVRLAILDALGRDDACVCHLEAALHQRQAYISQQLKVLREAGLIDVRREGWNAYFRLADPRVVVAAFGPCWPFVTNVDIFEAISHLTCRN